ncbi:MAG: peptide deformylase [Gammaproteobacteria bacterium]|nr:peptide deformylase [Gammaproteobacteria bacterium]
MAKIRILQYPDPKLKRIAKPVKDFGKAFQKIVDDMFESHYGADSCAALAATQLDLPDPPHVTVIDFSILKNEPLCLVNTEIVESEGEHKESEGCMSVGCDIGANVYESVTRAAKIKVKAQDRHGEPLEFEADGFMAKCIQHELDHLHGKIFLDHLSKLKRKRAEQKLLKLKKQLEE